MEKRYRNKSLLFLLHHRIHRETDMERVGYTSGMKDKRRTKRCRQRPPRRGLVVFLSCPPVKKHTDLSGSFLYSQSTMKDMYSKPTNRTELSIPMKTKSIA